MSEKVKSTVDWASVSLGLVAIIINLAISAHSGCAVILKTAVIWTAALVCLGYVVYAVRLCLNMADFDWNLINGHFLRKVCCIVLLISSLLTVTGQFFIDSPKELADERGLYEYHDYQANDVDNLQKSPDIFWGTYYHFIDPGNQHMTSTKAARVWTAIIAILGVFLLNGLLVSSIVGWIDKRKEEWLKGSVRYDRLLGKTSHYVIIGGNDMVPGVVSELFNKMTVGKFDYILIQTSRDVEDFRRELFSNLTVDQQQKVIIYYGNRNSVTDIAELQLQTAQEVYVLGEESRTDDLESYHDTMNMECLKLIGKEIEAVSGFSEKNKLVCRVMFEYQTSFNVFQVTDVDGDKIKFLPFNYYEKWAQNVLICQTPCGGAACKYGYLPLEGSSGIKAGDNTYVHLVIVGMSRMGVAMAIEAAHMAHYPNYEEIGVRTRITFIDQNAAGEKEFFMGRFKELFALSHWRYGNVTERTLIWEKEHEVSGSNHLGGDFIDIEWEFINGSIENAAVQQYLLESSSDENAKLTVAICLPENSRAIAAAAYMPDELYRSQNTLQVLVYQRLSDELVRQINANNGRYHKKMRAFGMARSCYDSQLVELAESIEPVIAEAYDMYSDCMKWKREHLPESENMSSEQVKLSVIEEKAKKTDKKKEIESSNKSNSAKMWSNHYNIYSMWTKFRCITTEDGHVFNPSEENFDALGSMMMKELGMMEHNRWVVEQLLLRYRPLTKEEQEDAKISDLYSSSDRKDFYKKNMNAHLDICSNGRLDEVDYKMSELDRTLISVLPEAYRKYLDTKTK